MTRLCPFSLYPCSSLASRSLYLVRHVTCIGSLQSSFIFHNCFAIKISNQFHLTFLGNVKLKMLLALLVLTRNYLSISASPSLGDQKSNRVTLNPKSIILLFLSTFLSYLLICLSHRSFLSSYKNSVE